MNKRKRRKSSSRGRRPRPSAPQGKMSPSAGKVDIHWVTDRGWVHTHGMDALGLPELEIRDCPAYFGEAAARILRQVCDYMLDSGKVVKAGENMGISERTMFHFRIKHQCKPQ